MNEHCRFLLSFCFSRRSSFAVPLNCSFPKGMAVWEKFRFLSSLDKHLLWTSFLALWVLRAGLSSEGISDTAGSWAWAAVTGTPGCWISVTADKLNSSLKSLSSCDLWFSSHCQITWIQAYCWHPLSKITSALWPVFTISYWYEIQRNILLIINSKHSKIFLLRAELLF